MNKQVTEQGRVLLYRLVGILPLTLITAAGFKLLANGFVNTLSTVELNS